MVKNFFEYVKELIPEKGSVFFRLGNHSTRNDVSLYQLADLLCGQKCSFAIEAIAYSWNVIELWKYVFPTMGVMFVKPNGEEKWCHFSKEAFIGAICIVAIRNGVTFDDEVHEKLRQYWERKLKGESTEEERKYFGELEYNCMNFDEIPYVYKKSSTNRERIEDNEDINLQFTVEDYERIRREELQQDKERREEKERHKIWYENYCKKREQHMREREALLNGEANIDNEHN